MIRLYTILTLFSSYFLLVSFSTNPPDGKTGAPGDNLCVECHSQTAVSVNGTMTVEGFPASITPGQKYVLTITNRDIIGNAVRSGFQMTILGPFNTKAGNMANPSSSSVVTNSMGRQYFEHNPSKTFPDSNVVRWTVEWTAPELAAGSEITYYAAGNIANGNFQETGDRILTASGSGTILLSSEEHIAQRIPVLYPNPGYDQLKIEFDGDSDPDGEVSFYTLTGTRIKSCSLDGGWIRVQDLPAGIYLLQIKNRTNTSTVKWSKI